MKTKGELFIKKERYQEQLRRVKKEKDTRQETLAEICCIGLKQFQNYIAGSSPIPADRLMDLCRYLDVSEKWLTGESDLYSGFGTFSEDWAKGKAQSAQTRLVIEYLYLSGISEGRSGTIKGVKLTPQELEMLYRHIMAAVDYTAQSCIDSILSCRGIYGAEIE